MDRISQQFSDSVALAQHGKELEDQTAALLEALHGHRIRDELNATGLSFSLRDGMTIASVLGSELCAVRGYALHNGRLVGCLSFAQLRDYRMLPRDESPLGEPLFSVLVDGQGGVTMVRRERAIARVDYLGHDAGKAEVCRQIDIALVDSAMSLVKPVEK